MTPSNAPAEALLRELSKLEDYTYSLSNLVTALVYQLGLFPANLSDPVSERLMIVTGLATKTETSLKDLMGHLGQIRDSQRSQRADDEQTREAKSRRGAQAL